MPKGVYPRKPRPPKRYGTKLVAAVKRLYEAGLTQKEVAKELLTTQKVVWRIMRYHGIERRPAVVRKPLLGPESQHWKGEAAGYKAFHLRVSKARGSPRKCSVCDTTDPSRVYDWANLTGRYWDMWDYARMCRHCHRRYDRDRATRS
jgi:hypothetical protein